MKKIFGIFLIIIGILLGIYSINTWGLLFMIKSFIEPLFIISLHIFIVYFLFVIGYSILNGVSIGSKNVTNLMIFLFSLNIIGVITSSLIHIQIRYFLIPGFILSFLIVKMIGTFQDKNIIPGFIQNILNIFGKVLIIMGIIILCLGSYLFYWKEPLNNEKILMSYISDTSRNGYEISISEGGGRCKPCIDENEFYNKDYSISYKTESVYGGEKITSIKINNANFITWNRLIWSLSIESLKSVKVALQYDPGIWDGPLTTITINKSGSTIYKGYYEPTVTKEKISGNIEDINNTFYFHKNVEKIR